jgi:hypothetical protein
MEIPAPLSGETPSFRGRQRTIKSFQQELRGRRTRRRIGLHAIESEFSLSFAGSGKGEEVSERCLPVHQR